MIIVILVLTAIVGGISGAIGGLIGSGFLNGLIPGFIAGGIVGFLFSLVPRPIEAARFPVESISPAGFVGGIVGSLAASAGWIGVFVSCGTGWVLGLLIPALFIALIFPRNK